MECKSGRNQQPLSLPVIDYVARSLPFGRGGGGRGAASPKAGGVGVEVMMGCCVVHLFQAETETTVHPRLKRGNHRSS